MYSLISAANVMGISPHESLSSSVKFYRSYDPMLMAQLAQDLQLIGDAALYMSSFSKDLSGILNVNGIASENRPAVIMATSFNIVRAIREGFGGKQIEIIIDETFWEGGNDISVGSLDNNIEKQFCLVAAATGMRFRFNYGRPS